MARSSFGKGLGAPQQPQRRRRKGLTAGPWSARRGELCARQGRGTRRETAQGDCGGASGTRLAKRSPRLMASGETRKENEIASSASA